MMESQSSLDDAIANLCTDNIIEQSNEKYSGPAAENGKQEKENVACNDLHGFLDDGDEDFFELNY